LWRDRPAAFVASQDDRSGLGPHESDDAADVDPVRRVLFLAAISGRGSADHRGAPAHGVERRAARDDASRRDGGADRTATRGARGLVARLLPPGAEAVQVAVARAAPAS